MGLLQTAYIGILFLYPLGQSLLLVGAFNPFIFKAIIGKYDFITIYFIVFGSFLYSFMCFLSREYPLAFVEELVCGPEFSQLLLVYKAFDFSFKSE